MSNILYSFHNIIFSNTQSKPLIMPIDNIEKMRIYTFKNDKYIRVSLNQLIEEKEQYTIKTKFRLSPSIPRGTAFEIFLYEYYYPKWEDIGNNSTLNETLLIKEEVRDSRVTIYKNLNDKNEFFNVNINIPNTRRPYIQDNENTYYAENRYYTINIRLVNNYISPLCLSPVYINTENNTECFSYTQLENKIILNPIEFTFSLQPLVTDLVYPIN